MLSSNNYVKLIDFGEAKVVDSYEEDASKSHDRSGDNRRASVRSDATSAFFSKVLKKEKKNDKKKKKKGTFVGTSLYQAPEMVAKS